MPDPILNMYIFHIFRKVQIKEEANTAIALLREDNFACFSWGLLIRDIIRYALNPAGWVKEVVVVALWLLKAPKHYLDHKGEDAF